MAQGSRDKPEAKLDDKPHVQLIVVGAGGVCFPAQWHSKLLNSLF
jgi:hypothetical protein